MWDCGLAFFEVCQRMNVTGAPARSGSRGAPTGQPGEFGYIDFSSVIAPTFANPITGNGEFGPFPSNMVSRNLFNSPGYWNVDLGIYKTTKLTELFSIQLRGELFNIVNHANDFVVGGDADVSSFTDAHVQPNGRRNVQFTLKLIF